MGQPPSAAGARLAAVRAALKRLEGVAKTKVFIAATTSEKTLRRQGRPANITYSRYGTLGSLVARKPLFTPKGGSKELRARAFVAAYPEFFALQPNRDT
ncbi:MAG: hypothetical protein KAI47_11610, partial [Deltaproteobacteria bacterium]|nr:hypothetical protein [Deltaproteobacteria bacterium]